MFMSLMSGVLPRTFPSQFGLALLLGAFSVASAQTAPQLLPYTVKVIAGGGTKAVASGGTCPVSGFTATDAYGDGCLANGGPAPCLGRHGFFDRSDAPTIVFGTSVNVRTG